MSDIISTSKDESNLPELTVGIEESDVIGDDDVAIQSALLLAKERGIPQVRIREGTYTCRKNHTIRLPEDRHFKTAPEKSAEEIGGE